MSKRVYGKVIATYTTKIISSKWLDDINKLVNVPHIRKLLNKHGWGNGYVGIPKGHPWYGKDIHDIECQVHGGLTYASNDEPCNGSPYEMGGNADAVDLWWIGFDTNHGFETKRTWGVRKVRAEVNSLLDQAIEASIVRPFDPFDL